MSCSKPTNPAARLTDDLILEILARLPAKSLCRFKCVSPAWRDLISHPHHRKKLPQTLAGFFYHTDNRELSPEYSRRFTNVSGRGAPLIDPSLSFLQGHGAVAVDDCCNGLLLCHRRATGAPHRYVVCNPATEEWVALPVAVTSQAEVVRNARLGFDPAVSPHFHVFEFLEMYLWGDGEISVPALKIYSSKTGLWVEAGRGWSNYPMLCGDQRTVFLNGFLHVLASEPRCLQVFDTEGKLQRTIPVPDGNDDDGFIGHSQGRLYYLNTFKCCDTVPKAKSSCS
ncbi:hypothetical protein ACP4OV_008561 [Aristida adscensionis]